MAFVETEFTSTDTHDDYTADNKESVFGGETDLWGASEITIETLYEESFEVQFDVKDIGGTLIKVDGVEIELFYQRGDSSAEVELAVPPFLPEPWASSVIAPKADGQGFRIVLVGLSGRMTYSDDLGVTWNEVASGIADTLWDSTYLSGKYYAVGDNGRLLTSADGESWTVVDLGMTEHIYAIGKDKSSRDVAVAGRAGALHSFISKDDVWHPGVVRSR